MTKSQDEEVHSVQSTPAHPLRSCGVSCNQTQTERPDPSSTFVSPSTASGLRFRKNHRPLPYYKCFGGCKLFLRLCMSMRVCRWLLLGNLDLLKPFQSPANEFRVVAGEDQRK